MAFIYETDKCFYECELVIGNAPRLYDQDELMTESQNKKQIDKTLNKGSFQLIVDNEPENIVKKSIKDATAKQEETVKLSTLTNLLSKRDEPKREEPKMIEGGCGECDGGTNRDIFIRETEKLLSKVKNKPEPKFKKGKNKVGAGLVRV